MNKPLPLLVYVCLCFAPLTYGQSLDVSQQLQQAKTALQAARYQEAQKAYQQVVQAQHHLPGDTSYLEAVNGYGECLIYQGQIDKALQWFTAQCQTLQPVLGPDNAYLAGYYNNIGYCHGELGQYKQERHFYEKALAIRQKVFGPMHEYIAQSYNNLAFSFEVEGQYLKALDYFEQALHIYENTLGAQHPETAIATNNLGYCYSLLGNYDRQLAYTLKAIGIRQAVLPANHPDLSYSYNNLGFAHGQKGHYKQALICHQKALAIREAAFGPMHNMVAQSYSNMGWAYGKLKAHKQQLQAYRKALSIYQHTNGPGQLANTLVLFNMGTSHYHAGNLDSAYWYHLRALRIRQQSLAPTHASIAKSLLNIGTYHSKVNALPDSALWYFRQAIAIYKGNYGAEHPELAEAYTDLASVWLAYNNTDSAVATARHALAAAGIALQANGIPALQGLAVTLPQLEALQVMATALLKSDGKANTALAEQFASTAIEGLEQLRTGIHNDITKQALMHDFTALFHLAIEACYQGYAEAQSPHYLNKAYQYAQKVKDFALLQQLQRAEPTTNGPNSLLPGLTKDLKVKLAYLEKAIYNSKQANDSTALTQYLNLRFAIRQRYDSLLMQIQREAPTYHQLNQPIQTASITQVAEQLAANTLVAEYVMGLNHLYIFIIGKNKQQFVQVPLNEGFYQALKQLQYCLSTSPLAQPPNSHKQYITAAGLVYTTLLQPVVQGAANLQKLIIMPDGPLGNISFEALLTETLINPDNPKSYPYLLLKYGIQYAYSGSLWLQQLAAPAHSNYQCLALAPKVTGSTYLAKSGNLQVLRSESSLLPGSLNELQSISKYYSGHFLSGAAASKKNFTAMASQYPMIHLATHGRVNPDNPLFSQLEFESQADTTTNLELFELYHMDIPAELVVLSACQTGTQPKQQAMEVMSLARGFMFAGTKSVVMSLWQLDDQTSSTMMQLMYQYLARGHTKDAALTLTKRNYLKQADQLTAHPYFWSTYILCGSNRPVPPGNAPHWQLYLWAAGVLLLLVAGALVYRRQATA